MLWIPIHAAGIINGLGHWWGYRNYDCEDASTNVSPWGFIIGGEELHNNHHTYPTSAKFSIKWYEIDVGWWYIRAMQSVGLAKVKKTPPKARLVEARPVDHNTLEAIIANRYDVMARYAKAVKSAYNEELEKLKEGRAADYSHFKLARKWFHREAKASWPRRSASNWPASSNRTRRCIPSWKCAANSPRSGVVRASRANSCSSNCRRGATAPKPAASRPCKSFRCACAGTPDTTPRRARMVKPRPWRGFSFATLPHVQVRPRASKRGGPRAPRGGTAEMTPQTIKAVEFEKPNLTDTGRCCRRQLRGPCLGQGTPPR